MDLHPEEAVLSGAEEEEREHSDQDLQIRRTVTQVGLQLSASLYEQLFSWSAPSPPALYNYICVCPQLPGCIMLSSTKCLMAK